MVLCGCAQDEDRSVETQKTIQDLVTTEAVDILDYMEWTQTLDEVCVCVCV